MINRNLFILFITAGSLHVSGQVYFQASNIYFQLPKTIIQTVDHGFLASGQILDNMCGNCDEIALLKLDSLGYEQWEIYYPNWNGHDSYPTSMFEAADGNFIFSGYDNIFSASMILYKVNPAGQLLWARTFGQYLYGLDGQTIETADHNYLLCGGLATGNSQYLSMIKISPSGNVLWEKNYSDTIIPIGRCKGLALTSDSGFILTGSNYYGGAYLFRTDSVGTPQWYKLYGDSIDWFPGGNIHSGNCIRQSFDGGFVCAGSNDVTPSQAMIFKTDQNGDTIWTKKITGPEYHLIHSIEQTSDSNYILTGSVGDFNSSSGKIFLLKVDQSGDTIWTRTYDDSNPYNKEGVDVVLTSDGGLAVLGRSFVGTRIIKTGADGLISCNLINSTTVIEPHAFDILSHSLVYDSIQYTGNASISGQLNPASTVTDCISQNGVCLAGFTLYPDTTQLHHYIAVNNSLGTPPISYTWYWGDGSMDTIPYPSHVYADSGYYDVCLEIIDSIGCTSSFCDSSFHALRINNTMVYVNVVPGFTTAMSPNNSVSQALQIYPNPSGGIFNISGDVFLPGESIVGTVYNFLGVKVLNKPIRWSEANEINISAMQPGIYLLQLTSGSAKTIARLVKM